MRGGKLFLIDRVGHAVDLDLFKILRFDTLARTALTFDHKGICRGGNMKLHTVAFLICRESAEIEHQISGSALQLHRRTDAVDVFMTEHKMIAAAIQHTRFKGLAAIPTRALGGLPPLGDLHALHAPLAIS